MAGRNLPTQFFRPNFTCFHPIWREKKWKTMTEYGHNSWCRNRCWAYNIPNRCSFRALQLWWGEICNPYFLVQNSLVFIRFGGKKIEKLWLNTAITLDPEIVAGPIIYQIEALFELYRWVRANPTNGILSAKIHLFSSVSEEKNQRIVVVVGHNFCSRNCCWDYNKPSRNSFKL